MWSVDGIALSTSRSFSSSSCSAFSPALLAYALVEFACVLTLLSLPLSLCVLSPALCPSMPPSLAVPLISFSLSLSLSPSLYISCCRSISLDPDPHLSGLPGSRALFRDTKKKKKKRRSWRRNSWQKSSRSIFFDPSGELVRLACAFTLQYSTFYMMIVGYQISHKKIETTNFRHIEISIFYRNFEYRTSDVSKHRIPKFRYIGSIGRVLPSTSFCLPVFFVLTLNETYRSAFLFIDIVSSSISNALY